MLAALIVVSVALAITLGMLFLGGRENPSKSETEQKLAAEAQARAQAEADLEKRKRELEEQKSLTAEAREQLKQAKRRLYEQKEADRTHGELAKARGDAERDAQQRIQSLRDELASALGEIERLKAVGGASRERRPERPLVVEAAVAVPAPKQEKRHRELSEAEKARIERLEHQANRDRAKAAELEKELKRARGRVETHNRIYLVTKGELDLQKDKFKALEKRMNRALLERDLLRRAIADLEKKTGSSAGRTELTQDEIAASDQKVEVETTRRASEAPLPVQAPPSQEEEASSENVQTSDSPSA